MFEYLVNLSETDFYIILCDEEFLIKLCEINNNITYKRMGAEDLSLHMNVPPILRDISKVHFDKNLTDI